MNILFIVLYTFPKVLTRNLFNNREFLWVIISFILENLTRGALGSIRNRKIKGKKSSKAVKRFDQNRKPHAKPSKLINFHIPVIKTLIDPIQRWQVEQKEVSRLCFALRGGENCCSEGRGTAEPKKEKPKTTLDTKSESPIVFLTKKD